MIGSVFRQIHGLKCAIFFSLVFSKGGIYGFSLLNAWIHMGCRDWDGAGIDRDEYMSSAVYDYS
ncbi:hypothetical protein KDAU_44870 [Dictyobacter aurantiacus]|uniref:Uncharacterized protein n=1 Tax=Dictyobacter aurantiacus TaxID=1936993 RepID=A0A401ZJZ9_9CHLR|nr:hypothetical protein KDAU_44870 [Dictyobacter aurantiacus]